jgi:hypothetical protein
LFYFRVIYVEVKKNTGKITRSLNACTGNAIILLVVETNESTFILRHFFSVPEKLPRFYSFVPAARLARESPTKLITLKQN